ncbi:MAG: 23S rRNA (pseudouridine(1915)-N(3))-methyltransferase RlmH [Flavobacteriales bacterium TMED288]|nr:23S rRNA (pseudouridine(1915)-N(3))-methyltransferase RlmH [Flavobacteriales bacterium]RPG53688.1 MAG: 23S rRNA (pseudouridine(1915)-N(3))-methyltransferase RlmH [Flavobacteriales bacterium TMED288]|tara:strand:- start:1182 stop:1652 length:471 start_codon:yes stop_codon:yes gene_type:complete
MKILILFTGKNKNKFFEQEIAKYLNQIKKYIKIEIEEIYQKKSKKNINFEIQKKNEAELIKSKIKSDDYIIILSEQGQEMSSIKFSNHIQNIMNKSLKKLVFIIGGPYGFHESIISNYKNKISLSKMTFSHKLIRLFLLEQIYRALSILNNDPYHH